MFHSNFNSESIQLSSLIYAVTVEFLGDKARENMIRNRRTYLVWWDSFNICWIIWHVGGKSWSQTSACLLSKNWGKRKLSRSVWTFHNRGSKPAVLAAFVAKANCIDHWAKNCPLIFFRLVWKQCFEQEEWSLDLFSLQVGVDPLWWFLTS